MSASDLTTSLHPLAPMLRAGLGKLDISLSDAQVAKLLAYLDLMQKWNQVYNLTAIRDPQEMLIKHILDSLAIVPYVDSQRLIDVGTGGGLPGVVLAIVFPDRQVDMLDSNQKKTRFLVQVKAELGLTQSQIIHSRVEAYQPDELYDGVISRAFASIADMVQWTRPLLAPQGVWWAMKGQQTTEDLSNIPNVKLLNQWTLAVPELHAERTLFKLQPQESFNG